MSEISENSSKNGKQGLFHTIFRHHLPLESETSLFILVNTLDFFVTYLLLMTAGFRESNPIARWFLEGWGVTKGLLMYKFALVTMVCVIAQIVATQKPRTAKWLLIGSSLMVAGVVVYSLRLLVLHSSGNGHLEL